MRAAAGVATDDSRSARPGAAARPRGYNAVMALTCNIDSRGRVARLIWGLLFLLIGVGAALLWAWGSGSWVRWGVSIVCLLSGAFAVFEARKGWCAVRAMGIRTPV